MSRRGLEKPLSNSEELQAQYGVKQEAKPAPLGEEKDLSTT